jgi:hypothetical protein
LSVGAIVVATIIVGAIIVGAIAVATIIVGAIAVATIVVGTIAVGTTVVGTTLMPFAQNRPTTRHTLFSPVRKKKKKSEIAQVQLMHIRPIRTDPTRPHPN